MNDSAAVQKRRRIWGRVSGSQRNSWRLYWRNGIAEVNMSPRYQSQRYEFLRRSFFCISRERNDRGFATVLREKAVANFRNEFASEKSLWIGNRIIGSEHERIGRGVVCAGDRGRRVNSLVVRCPASFRPVITRVDTFQLSRYPRTCEFHRVHAPFVSGDACLSVFGKKVSIKRTNVPSFSSNENYREIPRSRYPKCLAEIA